MTRPGGRGLGAPAWPSPRSSPSPTSALTFGGDPLFADVGLAIQPGERIALVGRNGSGKSTLMKLMAGLVAARRRHALRAPRPRASATWRRIPDFAGFATLGAFAGAGAAARRGVAGGGGDGRAEARSRASIPARASGGERRRAALAKLLAEAPDLMLLDEPTNHLDITAIAWLEAHLAATRTAFVAVSHDRAFLRNLTDRTLWVDRGEVRRLERGFAAFEEWRDKVFEEEDAARHKLDRLIKAEGRWAVEGISARRRAQPGPGAAPGRAARRAARRHRPAGHGADGVRRGASRRAGWWSRRSRCRRPSAGARSRATSRSGSAAASGWRWSGRTASGKTTLLNILTGALAPDSGRVRLGANLMPAVFDQNRAALDPAATLWETLTGDAPGRNDQVMVRGRPRHVVGYLKDFLFAEAQARGPVSALSGGERARLLLARLMARDSNLLVLDEPTNDLDVETLDLLEELIADYEGTVLLVSHDRDFIDRVATTTIALEGDGRAVVYAGGWTDYRAQRGEAAAPRAGRAGRSRGGRGRRGRAAAPRAAPQLHPGAPARGAAGRDRPAGGGDRQARGAARRSGALRPRPGALRQGLRGAGRRGRQRWPPPRTSG